MVVPIVIGAALAALTAAQSIWNIYNTKRSTESSDRVAQYTQAYQTNALYENSRYWNDYVRKHHLENREIRYPYRTGYYYDQSALYSAGNVLRQNGYSRQSSYVNGAFSTARSGALGYGMSLGYYRSGSKKSKWDTSIYS